MSRMCICNFCGRSTSFKHTERSAGWGRIQIIRSTTNNRSEKFVLDACPLCIGNVTFKMSYEEATDLIKRMKMRANAPEPKQ